MAISDLQEMLSNLDLDKMKAEALADIRGGKKTRRLPAVKRLRAIQGLERAGVAPADLVITKVPVIPAGFRPYTVTGETFLPGDANELYADLVKARDIYREAVEEIGPENAAEARDYLRKAVRAAYGYEDSPNAKLQARQVSGFFRKVVGSNPKSSWVQSKLVSKPQDQVGRAVISPDPKLSMDQMGIPEDMAWDLAKDAVEGALTARGIPKLRRLQMIRDRDPVARKVLDGIFASTPVLYSRSPAWHAQNFVSGFARIHEGNNIRISPLVSAGMNADYDGDCKSLKEKDLWILDGRPYFDTYENLVGMVDPSFPLPRDTIFELTPGRLQVTSLLNGVPTLLPVSHIHFHTRHRESREVVLQSGFTVGMTDDHGLVVYDDDGNLVQVRPDEAVGKPLPVVYKLDLPGWLDAVLIEGEEIPLDYNFGYMVGHYLGDGGAYDSDKSVRLMSDDPDHLAAVQKILADLPWETRDIVTRGKHKGFKAGSLGLWTWARQELGNLSGGKKLPPWILTGPEDFRTGVWDGMMSTDGSVSRPGIQPSVYFCSDNRDLADSFAVLSRTLGMFCSSRGVSGHHRVAVAVPTIPAGLNISHPERGERLKAARLVADKFTRGYLMVAPWSAGIRSKWVKALGMTVSGCRTRWSLFASHYVGTGYVSEVVAREFLSSLPLGFSIPAELSWWSDLVTSSSVCCVVMTESRKVDREEVTFDVTVPGTHLVAGPVNGLVTHQTMAVHLPALPEAIKDAKEKLLPSKMLFSIRNRDQTVPTPKHESLLGLYATQRNPLKPAVKVRDEAEAMRLLDEGKLGLDDHVEYGEGAP